MTCGLSQPYVRNLLASGALVFLIQTAQADLDSGPVSGFSVDTTDRSDVTALFHEVYLASEDYESDHGWTGDVDTCTQGVISTNLIEDIRRRINFYRAMAGLNADITFSSTLNAKAQAAALIMAHQQALSHLPAADFPANPCNTPDGIEAAGAGNLALGTFGPGAIDGYMIDDGVNNTATGHRRWLLYTRQTEMGTGDIPGDSPNFVWPTNCIYVIDSSSWTSSTNQNVAFPNAGYIPWNLVPNDGDSPARWSFGYNGADFTNATVTMKRNNVGITVTKETVEDGFGENTIVWKPVGVPNAAPDGVDTYEVTISNIGGGTPLGTSITYEVLVFDPFDLGEEVTITGVDAPIAGVASTYDFNSISSNQSYRLLIGDISTATILEGAEASPTPQIIDNTDAAYDLLSSAQPNTGSRSFHLTTPDFSSSDNFVIDRLMIPNSTSEVSWKHRRLFMHEDMKMHVEIALAGADPSPLSEASSFETLKTISGQMTGSGSFSSSQWDSAFISDSVAIPSEYVGKPINIRFRMEATGLTFSGGDNNNGLYIDDVTLTTAKELINTSESTLPQDTTSFDITPTSAGENLGFAINPEVGSRRWGFGPIKEVTTEAATVISLTIADIDVDESAGTATLTVTLSEAVGETVTVDYSTSSGTATSPDDFTDTSGTATIIAGQLFTTFSVPLVNDSLDEISETFTVSLNNPSGATIDDSSATVTILDNDAPPELSISSITDSDQESGGPLGFEVTLTPASSLTVIASFETSDGTAQAGSDYTANSGDLTFLPGETSMQISIDLINDFIVEDDETFTISLVSASNATISGIANSVTGTIENDDTIPPQIETPLTSATDPGTMNATAFDLEQVGTYTGLITNENDAAELFGAITKLKVSKKGTFSASILYQGEKLKAKGTFAPITANTGPIELTRKNLPSYTLQLQLVETTDGNFGDKIQGTVDTDQTNDGEVELVRSAYHKKDNPADHLEGQYTLVFPADSPVAIGEPAGHGEASVQVKTDGKIKAKGVLGDGTKLSVNGFASLDDEWMLFRELYRTKPKGHIGGKIVFRDVADVSDLDALDLHWLKYAHDKEKVYPDGFERTQAVVGSDYTTAEKNTRALDGLTNSTENVVITLSGGNLSQTVGPFLATWDTKNKITFQTPDKTERLTGKANAKTGVIALSYSNKSTKLKLRINGIIFEKQGFAAGNFIGNGETGHIIIEAAP